MPPTAAKNPIPDNAFRFHSFCILLSFLSKPIQENGMIRRMTHARNDFGC